MRVMFIIQGEGRGHMTQALALEQMLRKAGHEVCPMVLGTSKRREIPDFFKKRSQSKIHTVKSPNFYFDKTHKSIDLGKTFYMNFLQLPRYLKEVYHIHQCVNTSKPDVIINFYDVLGGLYFLISNPNVKRICVAHQYLASHAEFPFAKGSKIQTMAFRLNNFLTSMNSHKRLALSFDPLVSSQGNITVVPPLLRREIKPLKRQDKGFILCYIVNKGYSEEILTWHERNPKINIVCFWDNYDYQDGWSPRKNISFRHLNDKSFLEAMANCSGYVSTAGFESICEAAYLGKPIMVVPVKGQFEQACNALDAARARLGIRSNSFNLSPFLKHITCNRTNGEFRAWAKQADHLITNAIEEPISKQAIRRFSLLSFLRNKVNSRSGLHQDLQPSELDYSSPSK